MVDDDTFTYHVKQQSANQTNTAAHSLITKERMQKLDLLIHLLSNLTQALVVCGPEGIGKTTLLDVLQKRKTEAWRYCLIQGNADLSFEAVHRQLTQCIKADAPVKSLSTAYKQYENQHKQVVLIVDNAGELVPGLISAIIQYAAANPVLRVVFALTHDELQVKRGSDRVLDDCHIVEIPPLSEKQCGDFLQDLSTKPYANLSFKAIGENMIAHIYRDTHGVPGRIIAEVSGLSGTKPSGKLKWILVFAVAAAIAIAIGVQWLVSSTKAPGNALPSDPTSMDGGHAARQPEAVAVMQPSVIAPGIALPPASIEPPKNNDKEAIAPVAVEQETDISATPSTGIRQQEQSVLAPSIAEVPNEAKNALEPPVEVNAHQDAPKPVTSVAKPEAASSMVINPHIAGPSGSENLKNKAPSEPVSAVQVEQKPNNKQSVVAQQKIIEPLGASQEKPKQAELTKAVNDVKPLIPENSAIKVQPEPVNEVAEPAVAQQKIAEPFAPNKLETIPISQTRADVAAVPKEPAIESTALQQAEPGRIGSQPIATLPPSLAVEASSAQSDNNFTLQLMVLSKQSSADDMLKKYPALEPDIRVIKTIAKGKEKFILEYGSYPDAGSADKARQSLPFEFHNALVRKIVR